LLLQQVLNGEFNDEATVRALEALAAAERLRGLRPPSTSPLHSLMESPSGAIRLAAIRLAGAWKDSGSIASVVEFAVSEDAPRQLRLAALDALRGIGGEKAEATLQQLAEGDNNPEIRRRATIALAGLHPEKSVGPFFELMASIESEEQALALWRAVLGQRGMGTRLAREVSSRDLPQAALFGGLRAARDGGREDGELQSALSALAGNLLTKQKTPEQMQEIAARVRQGDPARGEQIYRRTELACATCHAIGGVGGKVGPDMTSLGASAPLDYLVESLYDPNAKIKEGYHSLVVVTEDNQVISGIEIESGADELVLRDANDKLVRIPQLDVIAKKPGPSLMPLGVVDRLSEQEQLDLLSFLSQLGRPGQYDASQGGVARVYGLIAGTHRLEQQGTADITSGDSERWQTIHSLVNGDVPRELLLERTRQPINIALVHVYLKTRIEVAQAGEVTLTVPSKADLWIDGHAVDGETSFTTELAPGRHTVVIRLDARDLPPEFRLESDDVAFIAE
jgi:putative heme-binding domain-containing protein